MTERDEAEGSGVKGSGIAFEPAGDLPPGVPVGDQTPRVDHGQDVTEKGGGPVGVKVPEEGEKD